MKSKLLGLIACMALISVSQVSAATLVGTTTDAMGIDGLVVDGVTYDVTFVNASYNTVFASTPPTFLNNYTGAVDAASALTTALNSLGVTTMHGVTQSADQFAEIPYSCCNGLSQDSLTGPQDLTASSGGWVAYTAATGINDTYMNFAWVDQAVFTPVETPLPAVLPLFATGLGGLGLLGWRRKRKAQAA